MPSLPAAGPSMPPPPPTGFPPTTSLPTPSPQSPQTQTQRSSFPFSMVHWNADRASFVYTEASHDGLYRAFRDIAQGLAEHPQYIAVVTDILRDFHNLAPTAERPTPNPPSTSDVADYLQNKFPEIRVSDLLVDVWAMVDKGTTSNCIWMSWYVMTDASRYLKDPLVVQPFEKAAHRIIVLVVLAHEVLHAATKWFFGGIVTPPGIGRESGGFGEAGWIDQVSGFYIEDPATSRQFYVKSSDILDWSDSLLAALNNHAPFPTHPVDFRTATPAPPPQPGFARNRLTMTGHSSEPPSPQRSTGSSSSTAPRHQLTGGPYHGDPTKRTRGAARQI
ncbi:hypothetical protein JCM10296v2_007573 [Rhodotorula toruloides]